jgi:hypothetical protein
MRDRMRFIQATPEPVQLINFHTPPYCNDGISVWKTHLGFRLLETICTLLEDFGATLPTIPIERGDVLLHDQIGRTGV